MRSRSLLPLFALACTGPQGPPPAKVGSGTAPAHDEVLMGENRDLARMEERDIDGWEQRHGITLHRTGSGVRVGLVQDAPGPKAAAGQIVAMNFAVELIDGRQCYSSAGDAREFLIEQDNVESGLHEAVQLLSPGDSAVVVIPSHRAHGLIGDMDQIPPRSTVIYRLRLLSVR
jgi:FKBP-type peptidyl-prolyl cis-trans isomerase